MTQDEIIEMAEASGLALYGMGLDRKKFIHYLEAFAKLIAHRKWVGLDEIQKPDIRYQTETFFAGAEWAERVLKENNT